ncbi:MAG: hypothetical protein IPH46_04965 [Bacteroidetes bacterium]|nr:hypothetical protein [Bacteroidota bacterium]
MISEVEDIILINAVDGSGDRIMPSDNSKELERLFRKSCEGYNLENVKEAIQILIINLDKNIIRL